MRKIPRKSALLYIPPTFVFVWRGELAVEAGKSLIGNHSFSYFLLQGFKGFSWTRIETNRREKNTSTNRGTKRGPRSSEDKRREKG